MGVCNHTGVNVCILNGKCMDIHQCAATGPQVQERQNRVCTTVAIAIVAETCSPFTVIPALMNEYRVPELNVQNGVNFFFPAAVTIQKKA